MYASRRNPDLRPLGRFAPVSVNSGLRPETLNVQNTITPLNCTQLRGIPLAPQELAHLEFLRKLP